MNFDVFNYDFGSSMFEAIWYFISVWIIAQEIHWSSKFKVTNTWSFSHQIAWHVHASSHWMALHSVKIQIIYRSLSAIGTLVNLLFVFYSTCADFVQCFYSFWTNTRFWKQVILLPWLIVILKSSYYLNALLPWHI